MVLDLEELVGGMDIRGVLSPEDAHIGCFTVQGAGLLVMGKVACSFGVFEPNDVTGEDVILRVFYRDVPVR